MDTTIKKILTLLLILNLSFLASAQIIGGVVSSSGNLESSWQNVNVYDLSNENNYAESQVSPEGYKYSFLNSMLTDEELFSVGSILRAEILDFNSGLWGKSVEMTIDSEEFQIFPEMEFSEVINLEEPKKELIISPQKNFTLKLNSIDGCTTYFLGDEICKGDCNYENSYLAELGKNEFNLITDCNIGDRFKGASRNLFESDSSKSVDFQKTIETYSAKDSIYKITFYGTKSSGSFSITDFIPKEFAVFNVSNSGAVYEEDGYYSIEWKNVASDSFDFYYYIKPSEEIESCEYGIFSSGEKTKLRNSFEDQILDTSQNIENQKFYFNCNFTTELSFQMVESAAVEKEFESKIKNSEYSKVKIKVSTSSDVENLEFKEYVPKEFTISQISENGYLDASSSTHNVIAWDYSGVKQSYEYTISSSESGNDYLFASELGGNLLSEDYVAVYNYVKPISSPKSSAKTSSSKGSVSSETYKYEPTNFSAVSESSPIIREDEDLTVALYSNIYQDKAAFDLFEFLYNDKDFDNILEYIKSYSIETTLSSDNRSGVKFNYVVNKSFLEENGYEDIKFYTKNSFGFSPITGGVISSDESTLTYRFETTEPISEFFIFGQREKLPLIYRIQNFFKNFFSKLF